MSQTNAQLLADSLGNSSTGTIPVGGIIMWSGSVSSIPNGWSLCDGSNSTPDLRNKFIVGASNGTSTNWPGVKVGHTGGSANAVLIAHSHVHNNDIVEEGSEFSIGPGNRAASSSNDSTEITGINAAGSSDTGQTGTNANLPPYYALAYIMRTS